MTHDRSPKPSRLQNPQQTDYDIGYGKPPKSNCFKPGQSGNPKGRPRGAKNRLPAMYEEGLKLVILKEAYRNIKVRDGQKNVSVPMVTAVVRAVAVNAAKGNNRAAMLFTQMVKVVEDKDYACYAGYVKSMIDYNYDWEEELERRRQLGIIAPEPIPHPEHIHINYNTGQVRVLGPYCKEDVPKWERMRKRKNACDEAIAEYRKDLEAEQDPGIRAIIETEIQHELKIRNIICVAIPD